MNTHETPEVENTWNEFWKPIVSNPDGSINLEQLKKELYDFRQVMNNVPEVYDHITGGTVSKILTKPSVIKDLADEHYTKTAEQMFAEDIMPTLQEINDFQPTGSAVSVRRRLRKIIKPLLQRFALFTK